MKIRFKARRIAGNDPITFRNPHGDPIMLENIGDVSQDIPAEFAHKLCGVHSDIIEIVHEPQPVQAKMAAAPQNKVMTAQAVKRSRAADEEEGLAPPAL